MERKELIKIKYKKKIENDFRNIMLTIGTMGLWVIFLLIIQKEDDAIFSLFGSIIVLLLLSGGAGIITLIQYLFF